MASGGVNSWPDYMQYWHCWLMTNADADDVDGDVADRTPTYYMDADINTARGLNPYASAGAYDPAAELQLIKDEFDDLKTELVAISPTADFTSGIATARGVAVGDEPGVNGLPAITLSSQIDDAVTAYENKITPEFMRSVGRLAAGYQEANAVQTTGFMFALTDLERTHQDKVTDLRDKLRTAFEEVNLRYLVEGYLQEQKLVTASNMEIYKTKMRGAFMGASEIMRNSMAKTMLYVQSLDKRHELGKTWIVAEKEQTDLDTTFGVKKVTWPLDLYAYAGNLLAAQSGGVYKTAADAAWYEKVASALVGGASAAQTGMDFAGFLKGIGDPDKWWS